jgi:hypothetical protein
MQIHFTNFGAEGPDLPIDDICELGFDATKEMDITQGDLSKTSNPITGTISPKIATCFPILDAIKFSFNEVCTARQGRRVCVCEAYV